VVAAAALTGLLLWRRKRAGAASWAGRFDDLTRRCFVAVDDVLSQGSVVTGQIQALAAEARTLETNAPDDPARANAGRVRSQLDELAATLEGDRTLRLSSPPPSDEQLRYSGALIRRQVEQLQGILRPPPPGQPPPPPPPTA
jgi:hypothetical protein